MLPRIILTVLIGIAISLSLSATTKHDRQEHRDALRDLRTSMHTWFERDVAPTLRELQRSYDASLTTEHRATLTRLRTRVAAERQQFQSELKAIISSKIDAEAKRERIHDARERMHARRHSIVAELGPILKASHAQLKQIGTNEEQTFDKWRDQARSIMDVWRQSHPDIRPGRPHGMKPLPLLDGDRKRRAVAFVLWDGNIPADDNAVDDQGNLMRPTERQRDPLSSPSPSTVVPEVIEVFDMNGGRLNTIQLESGQAPPSDASLLMSLPSGTYMVSSIDAQGMRRTRLVRHVR